MPWFFLIAISAVSYYLGFELNDYLFSRLEFSHGVNWIFLPSGLRLLLVLTMVEYGAIGISIASFLIGWIFYFHDNYFETLVTALISGFSPLIARSVALQFLKIDPDLHHLTSRDLLKLSILFALTSATLHQIWFVMNQHTENFIDSTFVMSLGDWLGTALVLTIASYVVAFYKKTQLRRLY